MMMDRWGAQARTDWGAQATLVRIVDSSCMHSTARAWHLTHVNAWAEWRLCRAQRRKRLRQGRSPWEARGLRAGRC